MLSEAPKGYQFITLREAQWLLDAATYQKFVEVAYRFLTVNGQLARGIDNIRITVPIKPRFNPNHAPAGSPEGGEFTSGEGGGGGGESTPASGGGKGKGGKGKAKVEKIADFQKDGVRVDVSTAADDAKAQKFLERWNDKIGEAPAEFKQEFLGGLNGTMKVNYDEHEDRIDIDGEIKDENGNTVADYMRDIFPGQNRAYSAYFEVKRAAQHGKGGQNIGKTLLKANVEMYQKLGLDKVTVSANLDVGGYAWAKYGYVPTRSSWDSLRGEIADKLNDNRDRASHRASGSGYTPEEWDAIGSDDQNNIERAWMASTYDEFVQSEEQNYRESGQALDDAKDHLAERFDPSNNWVKAAMKEWREGLSDEGKSIPYTNEQLLAAVTVDYKRDYEGRNDPEIELDDDSLPDLHPGQSTLPGIEQAPPISDKTREGIIDTLTKGFNDQAESDADEAEAPIDRSSIEDQQSEYWESMRDRDKYRWAESHGELPEYPLDDEDEEAEPVEVSDDTQRNALLKLTDSNNPKALWAIADSPAGKDLLLHSSWSGVLDLKDKDTMDRFNAYVGKKKAA